MVDNPTSQYSTARETKQKITSATETKMARKKKAKDCPTLRLREYKESGGLVVDVLEDKSQDIRPTVDDEGKLILFNGKPSYNIDFWHDFVYVGKHGKVGSRWVVANLVLRDGEASVPSNCGPDNESQDIHGDLPPVGRWSQYNRFREARWHVEKV